ncbi:HAMP domain-containing histidine kinase [Acetobacteraceae bacterium H6797]|nr:HAMP domain-containing histidine kinase [Acetobacteraceae bacterium H6797]
MAAGSDRRWWQRLWPRSLPLRVGASVAIVVLVTSAGGLGVAYTSSVALLRSQLDAAIQAQAQALLDEYQVFGPDGLRAAVQAQSLRGGPEGFALRLRQPGERPVYAGRPFDAPPSRPGVFNIPLPGGERQALRALGILLPDGSELVVAADLGRSQAIARGLAIIFFLTGVVTAVLAVVAGLILARRMEKRLAGLSQAALAVMDGDLTRRLPQSGSDDELDRLTATTNEMLGRIEGLMSALRQVTNDIAHDLRGPLTRVRQRLEGALAAPREAEADTAALEAALEELDGVLSTFAALLRIAQVEGGVRRSAFVPLDLSALAEGMAEIYGPVAEEAGGALRSEIAPGVTMQGDAALLRQLVTNLIENAIAHGGPGVGITLRVKPGPVLEVADTGPGVPEAEREKVLGRFYRLDRSRHTPGTGLGLALVAAAARLHGGTVSLADARPGATPPGLLVRVEF